MKGHPPAEDVNSQRFLLNNIFGADHIAKGLAHLVAFLIKCESMHKESPYREKVLAQHIATDLLIRSISIESNTGEKRGVEPA